ncbi:PC-Esterase protein [Dioscorea alata]|uniref:PC-Esterase protein n=1 Tax=Dioscorea alata TaxID=55571 RepID=A0ACB7WBV9_DIOAL|nr:PC-Esterase protein [Dioscorea alata]
MVSPAAWSFSRSSLARFTTRTKSFNSHRKWFPSAAASSLSLIAIVFLFSSLVCAFYLVTVRRIPAPDPEFFSGAGQYCDVFAGSWIPDDAYPIYNSSECPFAERGFNCLGNGRNDTGYLRWRWKPSSCDIPRFDAREALRRLRGKRIVFVGDSMSRTQWESLICMLMTGVDDKQSVYEVNGNKISKTIGFLGVKFGGFNLSVEFFRSVFLVQQGLPPKQGPRRVRSTLKLDALDVMNKRWMNSDVLVFNTGHWWTATKLFEIGCYFQFGTSLKLGLPVTAAFKMALETWASWVETSVNTNRTHVFLRTFEPSHWSDSKQKVCEVTDQPASEAIGDDRSEFGDIIREVVGKMRASVTVLNVTLMGKFRSDAHVGTWGHPSSILDCSHWCLPGVPDAWNELLLSSLFTNDWRKFGK